MPNIGEFLDDVSDESSESSSTEPRTSSSIALGKALRLGGAGGGDFADACWCCFLVCPARVAEGSATGPVDAVVPDAGLDAEPRVVCMGLRPSSAGGVGDVDALLSEASSTCSVAAVSPLFFDASFVSTA